MEKQRTFRPQIKNRPDIKIKVSKENVLIKFLLENVPGKNRDNFKTLLKDRQIYVDGEVVTWYNFPLSVGQEVEVKWEKKAPERHYPGIKILFEDQHVIVIEKSNGILSMATEKEKEKTAYSILSNHVKEENPKNLIFIVHRLDRETSGVMIFAKSEEVKNMLQETWNDTIIERTYVAVVEGKMEKDEGTIVSYLKESKALIVYSSNNPEYGQKAITHYKVVKKNDQYSLLELNLETGRKNQIRVHMQVLGHSIIGDKKYGANTNPINRLGLHALVINFTHPITKEPMRFETAVPSPFLKLF